MEQHDKWTVDKDFSRAGGIYCYKDGERTELQLCS